MTGRPTDPLTVEEWQAAYERADEENAFGPLANEWHSGQWSAFYRLQCNGGITSDRHAWQVASECRKALAMISAASNPSRDWEDDRPRLVTLLQVCEEYPQTPTEED